MSKNNIKNTILICFLLFLVSKSHAQIHVGITTQFGVSSMNINDAGLSYNGEIEPKRSYAIGVVASVPVKKWLNAETGLVFQNLGFAQSKTKYTNDVVNIHYLNIPVNARLNLSKASRRTKFYFKTGLYAGIAVGGNLKLSSNFVPATEINQVPDPAKIINVTETRKLGIGNNPTTDFARRFDAGFNIGLGMDMKRFLFGFNIQKGFANIETKGDNQNSMKNFVMGYYLSYLILRGNTKKSYYYRTIIR